MHRLLAVIFMVSTAYGQTVLDGSDQRLALDDAKAMMTAVLDELNSQTAHFSSLGYKKTKDGEDRDVICGIVDHGGEYAFYFVVSENASTILPKQMGSGGRDMLLQQLGEIGCPSP
jgi:hypothetical protein